MTQITDDKKAALEDLLYIGNFMGVHVKNEIDRAALSKRWRNIHAALLTPSEQAPEREEACPHEFYKDLESIEDDHSSWWENACHSGEYLPDYMKDRAEYVFKYLKEKGYIIVKDKE